MDGWDGARSRVYTPCLHGPGLCGYDMMKMSLGDQWIDCTHGTCMADWELCDFTLRLVGYGDRVGCDVGVYRSYCIGDRRKCMLCIRVGVHPMIIVGECGDVTP